MPCNVGCNGQMDICVALSSIYMNMIARFQCIFADPVCIKN